MDQSNIQCRRFTKLTGELKPNLCHRQCGYKVNKNHGMGNSSDGSKHRFGRIWTNWDLMVSRAENSAGSLLEPVLAQISQGPSTCHSKNSRCRRIEFESVKVSPTNFDSNEKFFFPSRIVRQLASNLSNFFPRMYTFVLQRRCLSMPRPQFLHFFR